MSSSFASSATQVCTICLLGKSVRRFGGLSLSETLPDETSILSGCYFLERHGLCDKINADLELHGLRLRDCTIVDASIIEVPSCAKSRDWGQDPEMNQAKKANQWHFGRNVHT